MPAQFEVEPNPSALEKRAARSLVITPGTTGNEFAVEPGQPGNFVESPYLESAKARGVDFNLEPDKRVVVTGFAAISPFGNT